MKSETSAAREELLFREALGEVDARLERGESLPLVERYLMGLTRLDEEVRAALCLYAWSLRSRARELAW
jgi:hypothetical protein